MMTGQDQPNGQALDVDTAANEHGKDFDDDGRPRRTGSIWTAGAHIITAVIGSGVLSLAWAIAQLGWIGGPIVMLLFSFVTLYCSTLLTYGYRTGDMVKGKRNYTYMEAVRSNLGGFRYILCGIIQYVNLFGVSVGYTIASAISAMAIRRSNCFHESGGTNPCKMNGNPYMIAFGVIEVILSQIPGFEDTWWLSYVAAAMSFTYAGIGLGLGIGKTIGNASLKGSLTGVKVGEITRIRKVLRIFQSLGNIAFAYSYSVILIEIQDTVKSPPSEIRTMKKAARFSIGITTLFYMSCGIMGYAAFGDSAPGNLLTGFGFYNPYWLINIANAAIVIHLVGAYQVFCQPLFAFLEQKLIKGFPNATCFSHEHLIPIPFRKEPYHLNVFRLVWRSLFVVGTTVIAMLVPFFTDVVGLLGALGFWPLTVFFPIEMYIEQKKIPKQSRKWYALKTLSGFCLLVSIFAACGSVAGIMDSLKAYKPFKSNY